MTTTPAGERSATPQLLHRTLVRPVGAPEAPSGTKLRYHAFDALRGLAMFLVVGLHSGLAYLQHDIPRVLWCVRDKPTLPVFDWFCWWCMGVSNPLFFTIAGFFCVGLYASRGRRGFVVDRARRVALPFAVGVVTILPACLLVWGCGWIMARRCTWRQLVKLTFTDPALQAERGGSGHLWFLEYLIVLLAIYAAFQWWLAYRAANGRPPLRSLVPGLDRLLLSPWAPLVLAVPSTVILWLARNRFEVDSALDRHNSFLIEPLKLFYNAAFFAIGARLYHLRESLGRISRHAVWFLVLSLPVFAGRAWLLTQDLRDPIFGPGTWALAFLGGLFSWLMVFGLIGVALRVCRGASPKLRYLADSSYWVYLVHMPVLGLLQVNLMTVPGHALWKAPLVLAVTVAIGLASYHVFVRYTSIGVILHGRRERPAASGSQA